MSELNPTLPADSGRGVTLIEDVVVSKIAGLAAREVSGVHALGGAGSRTVGGQQSGVHVEVGERQAAVDVAIVAEYGVAIHDLAEAVRGNIITAVERMTGLQVTEVNVTVHDVHLDLGPEEEPDVR
ncbi:Asp23/Gls24 family envelope stress response protein [Corynebacterium nasicanis]|uniref:Asp23/Gls24 family envelope stress response protein n=1 Tax=Corynebacterium nasicanis TaxID=1448267 RepID=A0ABW1QGG0_9CORY